jgi:sortase A
LQIALFVCGALALGYVAFTLVSAHLYQKAAARRLQETAALPAPARPTETAPPVHPPVADGMPLGRFEIPRLKVDDVVIEGDNDEDLRLGIGHIPGTALPGRGGNVGIAGHRDTFFRPLRNIRTGDLITLTVSGTAYRYRVESTEVVAPERSDVLNPTPQPHLTLVTCFPFYYVGSAPKRFIVHALEIPPEQSLQPSSPESHEPASTGTPHPGD